MRTQASKDFVDVEQARRKKDMIRARKARQNVVCCLVELYDTEQKCRQVDIRRRETETRCSSVFRQCTYPRTQGRTRR